jgi:hypothetical protein
MEEETINKPIDREALQRTRELLMTVASGDPVKPAADPNERFNKQIDLLIKAKFKLGWNKRRVTRYIKKQFNINLTFEDDK